MGAGEGGRREQGATPLRGNAAACVTGERGGSGACHVLQAPTYYGLCMKTQAGGRAPQRKGPMHACMRAACRDVRSRVIPCNYSCVAKLTMQSHGVSAEGEGEGDAQPGCMRAAGRPTRLPRPRRR